MIYISNCRYVYSTVIQVIKPNASRRNLRHIEIINHQNVDDRIKCQAKFKI